MKYPWRGLLLGIVFFSSTIQAVYLPPVSAKGGMVVTAQRIASQVGADILQQGGNAIDAAVAVGYSLAVVHPCCGNLGGGGFMVIHLANGKNVFINFRETAPAAISGKDFFDVAGKLTSKATEGYLAVGVPGTVMGLNTALKKYGTMPLKKVMAPAIRLAKRGYLLTKADVAILNTSTQSFKKQPNMAAIFLSHGKPYHPGQLLKQPELAKTLTLISEKGTQVFYHGKIAKTIVAASQQHGGVLSLQDFANYSVVVSKPLFCSYRGYDLVTAPPPGSGVTVCEILNIVSTYPLDFYGFHSPEAVHYDVEAMRYAFADRNQYLGDPAFVDNPTQKLLSLAYAEKIRSQIKPKQAGNSQTIGMRVIEKPNTTHLDVIDAKGNAVSMTYTLNGFFGAKVIAGDTGFFLNNELDDFALKEGVANQFKLVQGKANLIAPNKRPLSSMSPTIVMKNNKLYMLLGAAGGSTIITTIVETFQNVVDFKRPINDAVNLPRYHMQWLPDKIYREPFAFSKYTRKTLRSMGYVLQLGSPYGTKTWGQMAAIFIDPKTGLFYGENDNGYPAGAAIGVPE